MYIQGMVALSLLEFYFNRVSFTKNHMKGYMQKCQKRLRE
jgi:hypothetical protein